MQAEAKRMPRGAGTQGAIRIEDVVKVYDPDGATEQPTGASDSVPTCLEP